MSEILLGLGVEDLGTPLRGLFWLNCCCVGGFLVLGDLQVVCFMIVGLLVSCCCEVTVESLPRRGRAVVSLDPWMKMAITPVRRSCRPAWEEGREPVCTPSRFKDRRWTVEGSVRLLFPRLLPCPTRRSSEFRSG